MRSNKIYCGVVCSRQFIYLPFVFFFHPILSFFINDTSYTALLLLLCSSFLLPTTAINNHPLLLTITIHRLRKLAQKFPYKEQIIHTTPCQHYYSSLLIFVLCMKPLVSSTYLFSFCAQLLCESFNVTFNWIKKIDESVK